MGNWLFRDRSTGRIVVAQWPNVPLWIFIAVTAVRTLAHPHGTASTVISIVGMASLAWWAVDELARGVNPFRRILGAVVLLGVLAGLVLPGS